MKAFGGRCGSALAAPAAGFSVLLAALLAGCAASAPPSVLLSLPHAVSTAPAAAPAMPAAASADRVLVVRRVEVPEYLGSRRVRYRADPSTLAEWPNTFWAERVEIGVTREFVAALRQRLPGWTVCDGSCDDRLPALGLQLELEVFDYQRPSRQMTALARLAVGTVQGQPALLQVRDQAFTRQAAGDTPQAQAEAMSSVLGDVAGLAAAAVAAARP